MKYQARSLKEIAGHFDELATAAKGKQDAATAADGRKRTTNEMRALQIESDTWVKARDILLNTEIVTRGGA